MFKIIAGMLLSLGFATGAQAQSPTIYGSAFVGSNGAATLVTIDPATGAATAVGPIGFTAVGALAFKGGVLYGVAFDTVGNDSQLITINTTTGAGTLVGPLGVAGDRTQDIAVRPSDQALFAYIAGNIYTIDTATAVATLVGNTGGFPDGNALAFQGNTLLLANGGGLQTVDQATGLPTVVAPLTFGAGFNTVNNPRAAGMKLDTTTGTLYAAIIEGSPATARYLGSINPATGAVTDIGSTIAGLDGLAVLPSAPAGPIVPAPTLSSWGIIALIGLIGLGAFAGLSRRSGGVRLRR